MRCPQCQQENRGHRLYCRACNHRLFAWLGDPFGNVELSGHLAPAGFPWGKAVAAAPFVLWLFSVSPGWAGLLAVMVGVALGRWRRLGWRPFGVLLGVALLAIWLLALPTSPSGR